jgi:hypothetical protein
MLVGVLFLGFLYMKYVFEWAEAHEMMELAKEKIISMAPPVIPQSSKYMLRRRLVSAFMESSEDIAIPAMLVAETTNLTDPIDPFQEMELYLTTMKMFAVVNDIDHILLTFKELIPSDYGRHDIKKYMEGNYIKSNMYDEDMLKKTAYLTEDILKYYICSHHMKEGVMDLQVHKCTHEDLFIFDKHYLVDAVDLDLDKEREPSLNRKTSSDLKSTKRSL